MNEIHQSIETIARYLSAGVLIAMLVWESFAPCYKFFLNRPGHRFKHGLINLLLGFGNALIIGLVFISLWKLSSEWAASMGIGILHWFDLPVWMGAVVAVLLFDFWTYWWHRISHVIPFLWRFHRVHHSDPEMDVTTANRFHFGEIAISSLLRIPLIILIGAELWHIALFEVIMFPIVQFQHANVRLPEWADRSFRFFFASPGMHKIHHSDRVKETNSNYTSMLSVWDRIFRSFRTREDLENIRIGLEEFRTKEEQSVTGLLSNPLRSVSSRSRSSDG